MLFFKKPLDIPPPYDIVKHTFFGNAGGKMKRACAFFAEKCFAPVLFAAALAFVISCQNASDGDAPDQGGSLYTITENHELQSISASASEIVAKTVKDIVDKLEFKVKYDEVIVDAENNEIGRYKGRIDNVSYANLPNELKNLIAFMVDGKSAGYEYSFPADTETIVFKVAKGDVSCEITVKNGNYIPPASKTAKVLLKEILTEAEYNEIAGNVSSNLTLTAQTIKAVGDTFSVLESDAENGKLQDTTKTAVDNNKDAFVARAEDKISVSKNGTTYTITYNTKVKFDGEFNLSEISLPDNNGNGDFSSATLTGDGIKIDKLNTIRGTSLPTLSVTNVKRPNVDPVDGLGKHAYNLYKDYSNSLDKLQISGNYPLDAVNGKKMSDNSSSYTLFTNDDKAKSATDTSIKSLTIDALIQMHEQLKIAYFVNMIISGDAKEATNVSWTLTNIVFEGDMSKIKNEGIPLNGIVYFKNKVYNATNQSIDGLLKLDSLEGVSNETLGVDFSSRSAVFDVRGVAKTDIIDYNKKGILIDKGYQHAIYFSDDFNSLKNNPDEIKKLCDKFSNNQAAGFINAYLGKDRVNGPSYVEAKDTIGAKNPRSLKEFEYFGNYFEDNSEYRFEKSAKETYGNEFNNLSTYDQNKLNIDPYKIA